MSRSSHAYYYHEMYLPQLTAGPSSLSWSPDSRERVYSAGGSLWRQAVDATVAVQLTDGPGYDYQPDWSPDGHSIVYASNQDNAIELWRLDAASGKRQHQIPAAGGTDAMADYAMRRGPVGMNRTYVSVPNGPLDYEAWLSNLKAGRSFATNGPLLEFSSGGLPVGETLALDAARGVAFAARVRSIVPLDTAQVVCNGKLVQEVALDARHQEGAVTGTLPVAASGWCLLRAFTAYAEYPVLDNFLYATTRPVYVSIAGQAPRSPEDARYFIAWIGHLAQATAAYPDWNSQAEKSIVLATLKSAREVYEKLQ